MIRRRSPAAALLLAGLVAAACGKKGNPLPPLRPVPARVGDVSAHRIEDRVELRFTVPANADGTTPSAVGRVEIYRVATAVGAPPPTAAQIFSSGRDPLAEIQVRQGGAEQASAGEGNAVPGSGATRPVDQPASGDVTTFVDRVATSPTDDAGTWSYVVVGVAGRNRRGPVSAAVHVPIAALPAPPEGLTVSSSETSVRLSWTPPADKRSFRVVAVDRPGGDTPSVLTAQPITAAEFSEPVVFGRERCFAVRSVVVAGSATTEGPLSPPVCITAVDRYPPPAPVGLQGIQEGAAVTLNWTGVSVPDLAGYIVLRGDGVGVSLAPLTREPVSGTTFVDRTVQPGMTYTYSVYAVDNAATPNVSEQSNRHTVAVR